MDRISRFCEQIHVIGIAQVANSWSSLIFVVVAGWLLLQTKKSQHFIGDKPLFSYAYILIAALIGVTSFYNHATLSFWGGVTDFESMFLLITFVLLFALSRLIFISPNALLTTLVIINIPLTYIASLPQADMVFGLLVVAAIGINLLVQIDHKNPGPKSYFWLGLLALFIGYGIWLLDVWRVWCNPTSLIQGHAVWHLFTATAVGLLYFYLLPKNEVIRDGS